VQIIKLIDKTKDNLATTSGDLNPHLKMPPAGLAAANTSPTSTTLREEGNDFYKAGKLPQGQSHPPASEIPCLVTKFS
jgi:hypothetical protein